MKFIKHLWIRHQTTLYKMLKAQETRADLTVSDSGPRTPNSASSLSDSRSEAPEDPALHQRSLLDTKLHFFSEEFWRLQETDLAHTSRGQLKVFSNKIISLQIIKKEIVLQAQEMTICGEPI